MSKKIVVLGLNGFNPKLAEQWSNELPNLIKIQKEGIWGDLESMVPFTIPQIWISALCGKNSGFYGIWDFTYRDDFSYNETKLVNSKVIQARTSPLYEVLPRLEQKIAVISIPVIWPCPRIPGGYAVCEFMNSSADCNFSTFPSSLKNEICELTGTYVKNATGTNIDINYNKNKIDDKEGVLKNIYDIDSQRLTLTKYFINEKNCDCVIVNLTGIENVLDLFYCCFDSKGKSYESESYHKDFLHEYYVWFDKKLGEIYESLHGDVVLLVYSGYTAQKLNGRINLNEWLIKEGYMTLFEYPGEISSFKDVKVDWSRTKCWSIGYNGKLYLNIKGREPQGIVDPKDYDKLLGELESKLEDISDKVGNHLNVEIFQRDDIYFGPYTKYGPDIFVNFNEGRLGTSELIGHTRGEIYSFDVIKNGGNTAHSLYGYFAMAGPGIPTYGGLKGVSLLSLTPTVLDILGLPVPKNLEGLSILDVIKFVIKIKKEEKIYSEKTKKTIRSRLEMLGY